jgi:hypothetical protein
MLDPAMLAADAAAMVREPTPQEKKTLSQYGMTLITARTMVDRLKEELKAAQAEYDKLRKETVPALMRDANMVSADGKGSFTLADGTKIYLKNETYASCKAEDKPRLIEFLKSHGMSAMVKEDVHFQTLRGWVNECIDEGRAADVPPYVTKYTESAAVILSPKKER